MQELVQSLQSQLEESTRQERDLRQKLSTNELQLVTQSHLEQELQTTKELLRGQNAQLVTQVEMKMELQRATGTIDCQERKIQSQDEEALAEAATVHAAR